MILTWLVGCEGDIGHSCTFGTLHEYAWRKRNQKMAQFPLNLSDHIAILQHRYGHLKLNLECSGSQ